MAQGFIGEIRMFGGNFAPRTWALCEGQLLPISQNTALFSIIGTIYGGDGRTTFALPDLRGRVPIGPGTGPGLSTYREGQRSGSENVTLNTLQIPAHNHTGSLQVGAEGKGVTAVDTAAGNYLGNATGTYRTAAGSAGSSINGVSTGNTGGNQPHTNMQPYIAVNYIICLQGVFPSRN